MSFLYDQLRKLADEQGDAVELDIDQGPASLKEVIAEVKEEADKESDDDDDKDTSSEGLLSEMEGDDEEEDDDDEEEEKDESPAEEAKEDLEEALEEAVEDAEKKGAYVSPSLVAQILGGAGTKEAAYYEKVAKGNCGSKAKAKSRALDRAVKRLNGK